MYKCKSEDSSPNISLLQFRTTPQVPREKSPAKLLGYPYRDFLPNILVSMNANDTDQEFLQQNHLQMQEKHNATLGPKSQTTIQMQLSEGQYVTFVSNPDASHGFTWTYGIVKKLLNNGKPALIQLTVSGNFIMRNRIHIKVSSLTPIEFKEYKKQNDSTTLNAMFKAQPRPKTLTQTHGPTSSLTTPLRTLGQPRTTVQCSI